MPVCSQVWFCCLVALLMALTFPISLPRVQSESVVKSAVFLPPKFVLGPGSVTNKFYYNIDFPRGHIALKSLNAEVVDEAGYPVPFHETYLHHWVVFRYYQRKGVEIPKYKGNLGFQPSDFILVSNSGPCENLNGQYFGLGFETGGIATHVPDPYGIEVGNPKKILPGYEARWLINIHAIDTRGAGDRLGCIECRCDLYNVTEDEFGKPLGPGYLGGLRCCYDETKCRIREGFECAKRTLYRRYTVEWVYWDPSVVPVKIYIFDVTDTFKKSGDHYCLPEYEVESCSTTSVSNDSCIDTKKVSLTMPTGGHVIYGVGHQHTGGKVRLFIERMDESRALQHQHMENEKLQEMRLDPL